MNNHEYTKSRAIFLLGFAITIGAIIYAFKSSGKLQIIALIIVGLAITSGALAYVLIKTLRRAQQANKTNATAAAPRSVIFAELIESLAYMFFF